MSYIHVRKNAVPQISAYDPTGHVHQFRHQPKQKLILHGTGVAVLHFHVARWPLLTCDCFVRCSYLQACPCDCGCSCWEGDGTFTSYTHRTWAMRNAIALHQCIGLSLHPSVSMTLLCCSCCAAVHRGLRAHPLPQVCSNMLQLPSDVWGCIVVFLQSDALSQVCRRLWTCK